MHNSNHIYYHDEQELHGFLVFDDKIATKRPAVLIAHDWSGRNELMLSKAQLLAQMGYVAFALDMYGHGKVGTTVDEKKAFMAPFMEDRRLLRERLFAAYKALIALPVVDANKVAIIGYCFGGLCALDLARSGLAIKGAVSFHGLLDKPHNLEPNPIKAKIIIFHGYDDPMVSPHLLNSFCEEMNEANADWQVQIYGHVQHAFTNPEARDKNSGLVYNPLATKRSWDSLKQFFQEIF